MTLRITGSDRQLCHKRSVRLYARNNVNGIDRSRSDYAMTITLFRRSITYLRAMSVICVLGSSRRMANV